MIADAARNAARAALDAAKGFLGIRSPSRMAALQIGEPFAEGIGAGIVGAVPALMRAAAAAETALVQAMAATAELSGRELVSRQQIGVQTQTRQINIYGLTLEGVQDSQGLLAELQGLT